MITTEKIQELEKLLAPVNEFMYQNCNPHYVLVLSTDRAELFSGEASIIFDFEEKERLNANRTTT